MKKLQFEKKVKGQKRMQAEANMFLNKKKKNKRKKEENEMTC